MLINSEIRTGNVSKQCNTEEDCCISCVKMNKDMNMNMNNDMNMHLQQKHNKRRRRIKPDCCMISKKHCYVEWGICWDINILFNVHYNNKLVDFYKFCDFNEYNCINETITRFNYHNEKGSNNVNSNSNSNKSVKCWYNTHNNKITFEKPDKLKYINSLVMVCFLAFIILIFIIIFFCIFYLY